MLADGMGGHNAGEVAAQIAVETVAAAIQKGNSIAGAIAMAHKAINESAATETQYSGMGTTIVALIVTADEYEITWLGDSRAYKIDTSITQLTVDHNLAQKLVDNETISKGESATHPGRHYLTRALGISGSLDTPPRTVKGRLNCGEVLLLCSDGLHGLVTDDEIRETVIAAESLESAVQRLLEMVLNKGGTDNVSIIAVSKATN